MHGWCRTPYAIVTMRRGRTLASVDEYRFGVIRIFEIIPLHSTETCSNPEHFSTGAPL